MDKSIFYQEAVSFLKKIKKEAMISFNQIQLDHLCYRVESEVQYIDLKEFLLGEGELLAESIISGREISTFKLESRISYGGLETSIIELPQVKPGSPYQKGFEHAEFVVSKSFEEFVEQYPDLKFDRKGERKKHNPEIKLSLYSGVSLKFHQEFLEEMIKKEKENA